MKLIIWLLILLLLGSISFSFGYRLGKKRERNRFEKNAGAEKQKLEK